VKKISADMTGLEPAIVTVYHQYMLFSTTGLLELRFVRTHSFHCL